MKKSIVVTAVSRFALSPDLLAAVEGGAGDVQPQLGGSSGENHPSPPTGPHEPAKPMTQEEKRAQYEKYKDSDTKPLWMIDYKPE